MAIVMTDSTCDLTLEQLKEMDVEMLSLKVNFGDQSFLDKREITNEQFFDMLAKSEELPTTSLVSMSDFMEAFSAHPDEDIVVITISGELSGTRQAAIMARDELGREDVYVVDSKTATAGTALLVCLAARLRDLGHNAEAISIILNERKEKIRLFAAIDTLEYLVKGGRLSGFSGAVGNILSIKPIITVSDGLVTNVGKARGIESAVQNVAKLSLEANPDLDEIMFYIHSGNTTMLDRLREKMPRFTGKEYECFIGSVVGTHVGAGAVGIAFFTKD